jgi:uracil phosphoribosyltransferase
MHEVITLSDHAIVRDRIASIREPATPPEVLKGLMTQVSLVLLTEAMKDLATEPRAVRSPLGPAEGFRLRRTMTFVPILRAGLAMLDAALTLAPAARVGHFGLARDEETLEPKEYLRRFPKGLDASDVFILDPMLATGGSAVWVADALKGRGATGIRLVCMFASPEGLARMRTACPDVRIYAAVIDDRLNDAGFIEPGMGDAGDRVFGT